MTVVLASVAFWAPVIYRLIGEDGQPELVQCRARYRRLKTSERKALDRRIRASRLTPEVRAGIRAQLDDAAKLFNARERAEVEADLAAEPISDAEFLAEVLVDWELRDRRGEPVLYSPTTKAEVCEDWDGFEAALVRGYLDAQAAALNPKAVEKNSGEPSATGS